MATHNLRRTLACCQRASWRQSTTLEASLRWKMMMMIMMTMMLMMLMQMTLSFDERAARSDFTESTCIGPWGQRASGTHAIGRVAREGLRSPPGAPGQTEQQNLGKSVTECIWVRCVLGADDLCEKAGSAHVTWYPGQKQRKQSRRLICDAGYVTCYPRARVSHVIPPRACRMLPF